MTQFRRGDWIPTWSGKKVFPLDLKPEDICVDDIAHHLSQMVRFGGACFDFYSVAQHCLTMCIHAQSPRLRLLCLLHDAHEVYLLGDVRRPLKPFLYIQDQTECEFTLVPKYEPLRDLEARVQATIYEALGVEPPSAVEAEGVHVLDDRALATEARALLRRPLDPDWEKWIGDIDSFSTPLVPYGPGLAKWYWTHEYQRALKECAHAVT